MTNILVLKGVKNWIIINMAKLYIQPPSLQEIINQIADWIARIYRVQVTITVDTLCGSRHTIEVAHPDIEKEVIPDGKD